jgi:hypothetical protein
MIDFAQSIWEAITYLIGILGSVISFKLSFIFLLCVAYYSYRVLSSFMDKSGRRRVRETNK